MQSIPHSSPVATPRRARPCLSRSTYIVGLAVLLLVLSTRWIRFNLSPSVPYGFYGLASLPQTLTPGMLVTLPPPASVHHVWPWWIPLMKPIAALAGDVVCVVEQHLWVNGQDYGFVYDRAGEEWLPQWLGCRTLEPGEVFLATRVPKSLDGRYYGPVAVTQLTAQAFPLFTWR